MALPCWKCRCRGHLRQSPLCHKDQGEPQFDLYGSSGQGRIGPGQTTHLAAREASPALTSPSGLPPDACRCCTLPFARAWFSSAAICRLACLFLFLSLFSRSRPWPVLRVAAAWTSSVPCTSSGGA